MGLTAPLMELPNKMERAWSLYISGTSKGKIQKDDGKKKQDEVEIQDVIKKIH